MRPTIDEQESKSDTANKLGVWLTIIIIAGYLLSIGSWKGWANEKLEDLDLMESDQRVLIERVTRTEEGVNNISEDIDDIEGELKNIEDKFDGRFDQVIMAIKDLEGG